MNETDVEDEAAERGRRVEDCDYISRTEYNADKRVYNERFDRDFRRIEALEKNQQALSELTTSVRVMATEQAALKSDVTEIKDDVKAMMAKPARRWDGLVDKLIFGVVGAVVAWIAAGAPGM